MGGHRQDSVKVGPPSRFQAYCHHEAPKWNSGHLDFWAELLGFKASWTSTSCRPRSGKRKRTPAERIQVGMWTFSSPRDHFAPQRRLTAEMLDQPRAGIGALRQTYGQRGLVPLPVRLERLGVREGQLAAGRGESKPEARH